MKRATKFTKKAFAASSIVTLASLVIMPATSLAVGHAEVTTATSTTGKTSPFCTKLSSDASSITSKMGGLQGKVTQAWVQQDQKLSTDWQNVDQKVATDRQTADTERAADFTKLEAKATTGTQKQAAQTYEAAVNTAVSTRRSAYDVARQTFRDGVKSAIATRRSTVDSQTSSFNDSVNSAIATAEASCNSDPSSGTATRTAFVSSLRTARQSFTADRKDDSKVGFQVQQLAATRDAVFKAADQVFQTSLTTARQTLIQAFGKTSI
ncbi:MAG TPA: hypothetical protein VH234_00670 [Candidatus Saccharimonadales bacterium]|jgi:hypothetical protein|nr:hypothetical protein [Candidatus Saccharimonadales bacterium]